MVHILNNDCLWCVDNCWFGFFQFLLRWFIFCTMIAYGMIAGLAFSIFIEVVHILYNDCLWYDCWHGVFNFYWGGSYFVQLCLWYDCWFGFYQFLLRWFIFCTIMPMVWLLVWLLSIFIEVVHILYNDCLWYDCWYGVFNLYWRGSYFVQWLPMVWLLVWLFSIFYWGGSYFVQWLPMVWLLVWLFSIFIEVVHI